jgi:deoxyribonuclease IV
MANDVICFGPAGNSESFYVEGHKHSVEMPKWLNAKGLNAYEYSFGRGVNLKEETAAEIGAEGAKYNIALSVHAPYYINFANDNEESRIKSRRYLYDSAKVASAMGAARVVFHSGSCTGKDRAEALRLTMSELEIVLRELERQDLNNILLCPETMGKQNQQGTLDEIIAICSLDCTRLIPAIDFGHINALEQGSLKKKADFERIVDSVEEKLGKETANRIHVHFSHIEYGKSGEVKHLTFEDEVFGPDFSPFAEVLWERKMHPVIICESRDVMAEDALKMKMIYEKQCC